MRKIDWWKDAVIYQIYPKSFCDSDGDGIGDIKGIIGKLDYLEKLGIDAIWLCPIFKSPQADNGYDISDYTDIDPMFGDMADMEKLIKEAKERNIGIILDMVLNHSSDEHPWFTEAKKGRDNKFHDYYVWRDNKDGQLPNDMRATFGGPAWTYVPEVDRFYFHQFAIAQPDLNWDNPKLREELYRIMNFWIEKGVCGFRFDVIDQVAKEPDNKVTANGANLHDYLREMNLKTFHGKNLVTVGETWSATTDTAKLFSNPDGSEFSMVFQFEHILLDQIPGKEKWDLTPLKLTELKKVMNKWQTELYGKGWNSLFWNNHDLPRIVSRWGNDSDEFREVSAKMLATILYGMQGTPYIYQGEELGMTNADLDIKDCKDIETLNMYAERLENGYDVEDVMTSIHARGRDNARTPMQWNDTENSGFTTGEPWLKVNDNYKHINALDEDVDQNSVFNYYRALIKLRKKYDVFKDGRYVDLLPADERVYAYERKGEKYTLTVVCNFTKENDVPVNISIPDKDKLIISNYCDAGDDKLLRPFESRMYLSIS